MKTYSRSKQGYCRNRKARLPTAAKGKTTYPKIQAGAAKSTNVAQAPCTGGPTRGPTKSLRQRSARKNLAPKQYLYGRDPNGQEVSTIEYKRAKDNLGEVQKETL